MGDLVSGRGAGSAWVMADAGGEAHEEWPVGVSGDAEHDAPGAAVVGHVDLHAARQAGPGGVVDLAGAQVRQRNADGDEFIARGGDRLLSAGTEAGQVVGERGLVEARTGAPGMGHDASAFVVSREGPEPAMEVVDL